MKKISEIIPKGLAGKLIRFVIIFVSCLGIVFITMSRIQVGQLKEAVKTEENRQVEHIKGEYNQSMEGINEDTILQMGIWASDKIDDEFWTLDHDIRILGAQVEDVFRNPDNYKRIPVYAPRKANTGTYSLQLLYAGDYDKIDPKTMEMVEKLANLGPMMEELVRGNAGYTLDCYISTPDDVTLAMDTLSGDKFDENGNLIDYVPTSRPWYQGAVSLGDTYISSAVHSYFYNINEVVFGYPVYVDDKLVAVLEMSTSLSIIEQKLAERNIGEHGFSVLISSTGQLVCSDRKFGELMMRDDLSEDIRVSVNPKLKEMIDHALTGASDVDIVEVDGMEYYAAHAPLETIGWTQFTFASVQELTAPANKLLATMERSTQSMYENISEVFRKHSILLVIGLLVLMQLAIISASILAQRRVRPIQKMTEAVQEFVSEQMAFDIKDIYRTGDEIEDLAISFKTMSVKMKEYVNEIVANTAEKEKIKAEFEAASQIQFKMLPAIEPDFSGKEGYELYAAMSTAKEVGGDLYDFYYLDDDNLVLMIGDVSGKGITAALFMALSKQMIKSQVLLHGGNLVEAMDEANKRLCEESVDAMFVTVWIGILTLSTGTLKFVNAGHLYTAVKRGNNEFALEEDEHSLLMGALDFATYSLNTTTLQKGDILYLYTDGVTEAHNSADELFGNERMLEALNKNKDSSLEELDQAVRADLEKFVDGIEQYDDITTLCIKFIG